MKKIFVIVILGYLIYGQSIDCVGNSITANGYPEIVDSLMVQNNFNWRVYNYGVPGITVSIDGFDYINTSEFQDIMNRKSGHIVVMLGTNDKNIVKNNGFTNWEVDYRLLINSFRDISKKIFLGTVTYQIYSGDNDVIDNMNTIIKQIAQEYGLIIIDFNSELGRNPDYFQADGVHPTRDGKYILAKLAFDVLKTYPIYELGVDYEYWEAAEEYENDRRVGWFGCSLNK